jgi:hypothetical protein
MTDNDETPVDPGPVVEITEPGVYEMTNDQYHADPVPGGSLSSTGARALLPPGCPAQYRYDRDHPPETKDHFDLGHAAHMLVLGAGPELVVIDADNWTTKAAKQARAEARAEGLTPLTRPQNERVCAMAAALRAHPFAGLLFDHDRGQPEASLFWVDPQTGVWCRARFDFLPDRIPGARMIIPDYKTAAAVDLDALSRSCATWGYFAQDAWYRMGAQALGLADADARFVLVCQAKDPPHLVTVIEVDHVAQRLGHQLNRQALQLYAQCKESGRWPGHADDVVSLSLPPWFENAMGAHEL